MEFIGGVGVNDLAGIEALGVEPSEVARRGARILLTQIFTYGFFHADPHPGNLRVLPGASSCRWITGCSARSTWSLASGSPTS